MDSFVSGPAGLKDAETSNRVVLVPFKLDGEFKLAVFIAGPAGIRDRDIAADELMGVDGQQQRSLQIR